MRPCRRLPVVLALAALAAACSSTGVSEQSGGHYRPVAHAAPPRVAGPGEYTVQRGDTLYSIAFRNQLDYHDLADWNGIGRDYRIYPGRVLRLTPPGSAVLTPPEPAAPPAPAVAATPPVARSQAPLPAAVPTHAPPPEMPPDTAPPPVYAAEPAVSTAPSGGPGFDAGRWEWPTRGKVSRSFGADGSSKGIDIAGDVGQIVVAAAGGRVVYSGSALKGYGELVIIKHDEQYLSAYGYNRRRLVEEGQQVAAGQPIAELGVGPEQKPELHFEIRDRGRPVDPLPLLPKR
jgi:lipoprotein NlpD